MNLYNILTPIVELINNNSNNLLDFTDTDTTTLAILHSNCTNDKLDINKLIFSINNTHMNEIMIYRCFYNYLIYQLNYPYSDTVNILSEFNTYIENNI